MDKEKNDPQPPDEQPEDLEVPEGDPETITGGSPLTNLQQLNHEIKKAVVNNLRA
jgi:hypothetical protein